MNQQLMRLIVADEKKKQFSVIVIKTKKCLMQDSPTYQP
jgi:hypothetical protein